MALYFQRVQENPKGSNSGVWVDKFNKYCSLYKIPWCASYQSYIQNLGKIKGPVINSARAKDFAIGKTHSLGELTNSSFKIKPGYYRVKTRRGGNHVDMFLSYDHDLNIGFIIGGNVSDKVSIRKVTLKSMLADGTTHITETKGFYNYSLDSSEFTDQLLKMGYNIPINKKKIIFNYEGVASYYADYFHGRQTANGEKFNMNGKTAAHRWLKFNTMVYVYNPINNKSVIVRINDRGPYADTNKRIIDLSLGAAKVLGLKLGKVKLKILGNSKDSSNWENLIYE